MAKLVQRLADSFGLPATFTLDACRHGGMTELEEAALTTGQGRALSGHRSERAYAGYAKPTMERALRQPVSGMPIDLRTKSVQPFRMARKMRFGTGPETTVRLLPNPLGALNYAR